MGGCTGLKSLIVQHFLYDLQNLDACNIIRKKLRQGMMDLTDCPKKAPLENSGKEGEEKTVEKVVEKPIEKDVEKPVEGNTVGTWTMA